MGLTRLPLFEILLRLSVALAFLYPPVAAIIDHYSWIGYFPAFMTDLVAPHELVLLHTFGVLEAVIAFWIIFGKRPWIPAGLAAIILVLIVVTSPAQFPVLFRDLSIALSAAALLVHYYPRNTTT